MKNGKMKKTIIMRKRLNNHYTNYFLRKKKNYFINIIKTILKKN